ncbi:hypothetical protein POKO110462_21110 [Pontibacter korlensis]
MKTFAPVSGWFKEVASKLVLPDFKVIMRLNQATH